MEHAAIVATHFYSSKFFQGRVLLTIIIHIWGRHYGNVPLFLRFFNALYLIYLEEIVVNDKKLYFS